VKEATLERALHRYERAPHLVFWETTKACSLACRHCRAEAQLEPLDNELTSAEGMAFIDQVADLDGPVPILVFTGGDCFERADIVDLVSYARMRGLRVGIAPSVTDRLTRPMLETMYELGVRSVSISLDGSTASSHDNLRGIPGHFDKTLRALRLLREMGFRVQVNTTVMRHNAEELASIYLLLRDADVSIWEVFFLVGVGRGVDIAEVSSHQAEDICHFLVDTTALGMTVRTVEGPFYRRVQAERAPFGADDPTEQFELGELYGRLRQTLDDAGIESERAISATTLATGDGRGIIFVGYDGSVHASGFLPIPLGNVRDSTLSDIYTSSAQLTSLRAGNLSGVCGTCDYSRLCGGSRARAFAHFDRVDADDPSCVLVGEPMDEVSSIDA
jgi:radical SAM protein